MSLTPMDTGRVKQMGRSIKCTNRIEDIKKLLMAGVSAEDITVRLGVTPQAIAAQMYRYGRTDLARPFWALHRRNQSRKVKSQ